MESFKIKVTPADSKKLQQYLFEQGIKWLSGDITPKYLNSMYLYVNADRKIITRGDLVETFEDHSFPEKTMDEIMKEYTVSKEFIQEAYEAACATWKEKLVEQFPEVLGSAVFKPVDNINELRGVELLRYACSNKFERQGIWLHNYDFALVPDMALKGMGLIPIKVGSSIPEAVYYIRQGKVVKV